MGAFNHKCFPACMRYLAADELGSCAAFIEEAKRMTTYATCKKSQRGVVFTKRQQIVGRGYNGPPRGFSCLCDVDPAVCGKCSVHAEKRALFEALPYGVPDRGYHMKRKGGLYVASVCPACLECSKDMLEVGVKEFVLQQQEGFVLYDMHEFHKLTLRHVLSCYK